MNPIYSFKITSKNAAGLITPSTSYKIEYSALNETLARLAKERIFKGHTDISVSIKSDPKISLDGFIKDGKVWKINGAAEEFKASEKISKHTSKKQTSSKKDSFKFFKKKNLEIIPKTKPHLVGKIGNIPYEIWAQIFNYSDKKGALSFTSTAFSFRNDYFPFLFEKYVENHVFKSFDNPIFSSKMERIKVLDPKKFIRRVDWIPSRKIKPAHLSNLFLTFLKVENIDEKDLLEDMNIYENLTELHLCKWQLSSNVFKKILENCPKLKKLHYESYSYMFISDLNPLIENCPDLETLTLRIQKEEMFDVSKESFVKFIAEKKKLNEVSLQRCFSSEDKIYIAEQTKKLNEIEFSNQSAVTDQYFISLIPNYPYLKKLNLQDCADLTDKALEAFTEPLPFLEEIIFPFRGSFTESGLIELLKKTPNLKKFYLKKMRSPSEKELILSDASLKAFSQNCPHLQTLYLDSVSFTDKGIIGFAKKCSKIEVLRFHEAGITDVSLVALRKYCPNLKEVILIRCPKITLKGVAELATCPKVKKLWICGRRNLKLDGLEKKFPKVEFNTAFPMSIFN